MDLYQRMGAELRLLFSDLFDAQAEQTIREQIAKILKVAHQIGGKVQEEAEHLNADVLCFLKNPADPSCQALMKKHALRLEQETREL